MEEVVQYSSIENMNKTNPMLNIKDNYSLSYGEITNLIRWVNSINDPLCKQVNSIKDLKQGNIILALLYRYLIKTNNTQILKFLDSLNINISNVEKMKVVLKILYKIDTNNYIKNNFNFFDKNIENILNDNNMIFEIIKCINNLYKNKSKTVGKFYSMKSSPNIFFEEENEKISKNHFGTKSIIINQQPSSTIDSYNDNLGKDVFVSNNNLFDEIYPNFIESKINKSNNYSNFNQSLNINKKNEQNFKNNNNFENYNHSYSRNNLNYKKYLTNSAIKNNQKTNNGFKTIQKIYYPVKLYNNNNTKEIKVQRNNRKFLLDELEKLNEINDVKNKNKKASIHNSYNSYKNENIDKNPIQINKINFNNNAYSRALSQKNIGIKNINKKNFYRNRLYNKAIAEYKKNNNLSEPSINQVNQANQEEKIPNKNNLNIKNIFGIIDLDENVSFQDNITSNNINIYKITKLPFPIIDITYKQIQKYNTNNQNIILDFDSVNEKINNEKTENKTIFRNNSSLQTSIYNIKNNTIQNNIIRNNSINNAEKINKKTDSVPPLIKNIVYLWLNDIELIKKNKINIDSLPIACSDGIILCDIINRFESRNNVISGVFRKINTRSQSLVNIKKALEHLKKIGKFPLKHLWKEENINQGDEKVIWELLYDLYKYYSKITGYKSNYRNQLINENNSCNFVNKQNNKYEFYSETNGENNDLIKSYNDNYINDNIFINNDNHEEYLEEGINPGEEKNNIYHKSMLKMDKDDDINNFDFYKIQYDKYESRTIDDDEYKKNRLYYGIKEKGQNKINKKFNYNYNELNNETENSSDIRIFNKDS